jgi:cytochrome P450
MSFGEEFVDLFEDCNDDGIILIRKPFRKNSLLLSSPRSLREVLVSKAYEYHKPLRATKFLRRFLGHGLVVAEGDEHKFQRKNTQPAFSFRHVKELYPVMWRKSLGMVQGIRCEMLDAQPVEMYSWASKAALDVIGIAGLGRDFNRLRSSDDELLSCYEELFETSAEKGAWFLLTLLGPTRLIQLLPWRMNRLFLELAATLRTSCRDFVLEKKALIEASADDHFDILSLLIKSGDFGDEALADQLLTFLAAG